MLVLVVVGLLKLSSLISPLAKFLVLQKYVGFFESPVIYKRDIQ